MNEPCFLGYWEEQCDKECHCDGCDRDAGCINSQCLTGYWGLNCETECHCLNGAACDRGTGQCEADIATGLSLCEPGYVSDNGINLNNCQQGMWANC